MTSPGEGESREFGAQTTALEVVAGHDLHGRNAIVTGGASGIGVETVRALATAGARVVIATRDLTKAQEVAAILRAESGEDAIEAAGLDLASLASVRQFVASYLSRRPTLDLLINNAGIMATLFSHTTDGFESQFGTNHLGHFALTVGLLPALRAAGGARVVSLSSSGHRLSDVMFDDLNFEQRPYDPWAAYGQSKTANVLFAVALTARHAGDGIVCNAVMPGGIMTGLQKHLTHEFQVRAGWIDEAGNVNPRFKTAAQGAATSVWAAVAPELNGVGGRYLEDCTIAEPSPAPDSLRGYQPYAMDQDHARRLWSVSEEMVAG